MVTRTSTVVGWLIDLRVLNPNQTISKFSFFQCLGDWSLDLRRELLTLLRSRVVGNRSRSIALSSSLQFRLLWFFDHVLRGSGSWSLHFAGGRLISWIKCTSSGRNTELLICFVDEHTHQWSIESHRSGSSLRDLAALVWDCFSWPSFSFLLNGNIWSVVVGLCDPSR